MNPNVSVILPTYNRAHLIKGSLQSVLDQSYRDFEVIVVDDGSTDNTEEVIRGFKDNRIRYIRCNNNRGASAARNTGLQACRGKYVAFIDSDDIWKKDKLKKQVDVFLSSPAEVGVVYTALWHNRKQICSSIYIHKKDGDLHEYLLHGPFFIIPSVAMIRKDCFKLSGTFDERLKTHGDWDLMIRISKHYHFRFIDEPLVIKYTYDDNISNNIRNAISGREAVLRKYRKDFRRIKPLLYNIHFDFGYFLYTKGARLRSLKYFIKAFTANSSNKKALLNVIIMFLFRKDTYEKAAEERLRLRKKLREFKHRVLSLQKNILPESLSTVKRFFRLR